MDSSDFLRQILFQPYLVKKTPYVRRTSPGTRMFLLTIYLPWLLNMLPYSYWALTCNAALPTYSAFMISVRQASDLPPASFRFPVTRDTLALGYILPAVGRIRDFHPLKHAPAGRTSKNGNADFLHSPFKKRLPRMRQPQNRLWENYTSLAPAGTLSSSITRCSLSPRSADSSIPQLS